MALECKEAESSSSPVPTNACVVQKALVLPEPTVLPPPMKITNFYIEDILKPDFGCKAKKRWKNCPTSVSTIKRERETCENLLNSNRTALNAQQTHRVPPCQTVQTEAGVRKENGGLLWPAWVYCTRYSDRPSSGPRIRKVKKHKRVDEKRPRTAFTNDQLQRLKREFDQNRYLTEQRRQELAAELGLNESQIKIWFQNKRAKLKKSTGSRNKLAMQLIAQGLYNHATVPISEDEDDSGS